MTTSSYHQFCPVAMASEVLCNRWTMILIRELCAGSTRFNDLRRGVPRMSPALLSKRLKGLVDAGVVERVSLPGVSETFEYRLTEAGRELHHVVDAIGTWGQRWVESEPSLNNLDPELLMWDMHRNLNVEPLPQTRLTIQFIFPDMAKARQNWWLLIDPEKGVDLCSVDPGFDVDLFVRCELRTMTAIWMGLDKVQKAVDDNRMALIGNKSIAHSMQNWLKLSPFAVHDKQVA